MTKREDLVQGVSAVHREGMRVMSSFGPEDWKVKVLDEGGNWTRKQAYCHLTATAEVTPGLVGGLANAGAGNDVAATLDLDAFNAQAVAGKEQLSEQELMSAYDSAFTKLIDFVKTMPEEQLTGQAKFGRLEGEVSDILSGVLTLHGMAHIYGAGGSPLG
jgi:hypothetical protein